MGVEYLTEFAKTLDKCFTGLSECGLLTKYTVQLQADLVDLELVLKFRNLICQLIKSLQVLLAKIPILQTTAPVVDVGTQTSFNDAEVGNDKTSEEQTELVVTCHPITLTAIANNSSFVAESNILNIRSQPLCLPSESIQNQDTAVIDKNFLEDASSEKQSTNICELKPMVVTEDKDCTEVMEREASNIVHIVVDTTEHPQNSVQETINDVASGVNVELHCEECDTQLKSSGSLESDLQNQRFCNMCDQVFNCVQKLQDHCRSVHNGVGCFMCPTCCKRFMTKFSYIRHMESHSGKKGAICHVCGKSFNRADYLQTHYTTHVGKRSFACSQCPKKFVRSIQLKSHEKTHTGIKDYICKMCNRGFARSDKLRDHMLRHLNIKRFQCATCKRFYAEKRDLKTHLKVHMKT